MITKEKYDLIVKLLKKGRTNREICKNARCSSNEITPIRKTIFGETTGTGIDMKGKSTCAQVFDLLEKGTSLPQIVIEVDIDPKEAMKLQGKYLHVLKMDNIIHFLNNHKDLDLIIEILEFLKANSNDLDEIKNDIKVNEILYKHFDEQINEQRKELGLEQY